MSGVNDEVEYCLEVEEEKETNMTCLGSLVFMDRHFRHPEDSSKKQNDALSLAYEDLLAMPDDIIIDFGPIASHLDISHNMFSRNLRFLLGFDNLKSLNLDYNKIDDATVFPYMPYLELLYLNYNLINNLHPFIENLQKSVPNLKYLCLMGNKAVPSFLNSETTTPEYVNYRLLILSQFPRLVHLDDSTVTDAMREEAKKRNPLLICENLRNCMKNIRNKIIVISKPNVCKQVIPKETNSVV